MPRYAYEAEDRHGQPVEGVVEAVGVVAAAQHLEAMGLTVHRLGAAGDASSDEEEVVPLSQASQDALDRLAADSETLAPALAAYARELPLGRRRADVYRLAQRLASDDPQELRQEVARRPLLWAPLLASAAGSNGHEETLARYLGIDRADRDVRRRWRLTLAYPVAVLALALVVAWPIAVFIAPTCEQLYNEFGLELPPVTVAFVATARMLRSGGAIVAAVLLAGGAVAVMTWPAWAPDRVTRITRRVGGWFFERPAERARCARDLANLLDAGFEPADSWRLIQAGGALTPAIDYALSDRVPTAVRGRVLRQIAAGHRDRAADTSDWAAGTIGPLATVVVGGMVGLIVVALYLPLVRLIEGLT